jgi:hypothetical protein
VPNVVVRAPSTADIRCGTTAGYKAHRKRCETTCQPCRDAMAQYQRERGSRAEYLQAYYLANAEQLRRKARQWYRNNTDRAAASSRRNRAANPNRHREHNRRWRAANLAKTRTSSNEWRKRNLHKGRETERRRRARLVGEPYTEADALAAYGVECHLCGEPIDLLAPRRIGRPGWERGLHLDHVLPIVAGGADSLENVRPAHGRCNVVKGARHSE